MEAFINPKWGLQKHSYYAVTKDRGWIKNTYPRKPCRSVVKVFFLTHSLSTFGLSLVTCTTLRRVVKSCRKMLIFSPYIRENFTGRGRATEPFREKSSLLGYLGCWPGQLLSQVPSSKTTRLPTLLIASLLPSPTSPSKPLELNRWFSSTTLRLWSKNSPLAMWEKFKKRASSSKSPDMALPKRRHTQRQARSSPPKEGWISTINANNK